MAPCAVPKPLGAPKPQPQKPGKPKPWTSTPYFSSGFWVWGLGFPRSPNPELPVSGCFLWQVNVGAPAMVSGQPPQYPPGPWQAEPLALPRAWGWRSVVSGVLCLGVDPWVEEGWLRGGGGELWVRDIFVSEALHKSYSWHTSSVPASG